MGNNHNSKIEFAKEKEDQLTNLLTESKKFIGGDQTPFQFIQNSYEHQHNKIKETSELGNTLNTKSIVDYALNIYSDILPNITKINNALYSPFAIMKFNSSGDKDMVDFFSQQAIYINNLAAKHKELLNAKNKDDHDHDVSSIELSNENEEMINSKSNLSLIPINTFGENKIVMKKKSEDELIGKQNRNHKKALLLTPDVYISKKESCPQKKSIQSSSNIQPNAISNSFGLNTLTKQSQHGRGSSNIQDDLQQGLITDNEGIDKKYHHFISSVISNIDPPSNDQPIQFKLKAKHSHHQSSGEKPSYKIVVIQQKQNNILSKIETNNHHLHLTQCKKYFKLKKEIEEEQIIKQYCSSRKAKAKTNGIQLRIDIRTIPTLTNNGLNDSSNLSQANYNIFMNPQSKRSENKNQMHTSINNKNGILPSSPCIEEAKKSANVSRKNKNRRVITGSNDSESSLPLIQKRKTVEIISIKNINNDLSSCVNHQNKHQSKSILSMPKHQSRQDGSLNGLLISLDRNNQLKKSNQKKYDEIIAKLNLPSYKIDCGPLDILNNVDNNFNITESLLLYKSKNKFLFEYTEEERKLEEIMKQ